MPTPPVRTRLGGMSQDVTAIEHQLARYCSHVGADVELAAELYTEDAVLEFPQTAERFEGRDSFTQWRAQALTAAGDDVRFRLTRTTVRPGFSVVELSGSYDRGVTWQLGVQLADWDGDRIVLERIYVMDGFEAPEWRRPWRAPEPADPPTSPPVNG
jgi:SnoaL-like domain